MKIDHHRGPVSGVKVSQASDVLISASHDATICMWSLDDYTLLNSIQMAAPVIDFRISVDSVSSFGKHNICRCRGGDAVGSVG